jgi:polyhydroxybutyrate depolymerase
MRFPNGVDCRTGAIRQDRWRDLATVVMGKDKISLVVLLFLSSLLLPNKMFAGSLVIDKKRGVNSPSQADEQFQEAEYTRNITLNGLKRSYTVYIPKALPKGPVPVILAFHPLLGTSKDFAKTTNLSEQAGRLGFVVVFPQGYGRSWNAGDCCGRAQKQGVDDVAFIRELLDDLASVVNVDSRRVFATGFSNGAKMAYRLACELSQRIAAIATVGAAISMSDFTCNPKRPVPVLHFHGLEDEHAPFKGGPSKEQPSAVQQSVPGTIRLWLQRNSCANDTRLTYKKGAATCVTYLNCQKQAEVILCTIEGMGHVWPGYTPPRWMERWLGPGTHDISATDFIVNFFRAHPMP